MHTAFPRGFPGCFEEKPERSERADLLAGIEEDAACVLPDSGMCRWGCTAQEWLCRGFVQSKAKGAGSKGRCRCIYPAICCRAHDAARQRHCEALRWCSALKYLAERSNLPYASSSLMP